MLKRGNTIIITNRGVKEVGVITRRYRRKDIVYYDVTVERGYKFEGLTSDRLYPVFVELDLSIKMNSNKLILQ